MSQEPVKRFKNRSGMTKFKSFDDSTAREFWMC